jgi:heterotetrameric sarcosine oxidase gamma subunit
MSVCVARPVPFEGVQIRSRPAEVTELAVLRTGIEATRRFGASCGEPLPGFGQVSLGSRQLTLCVRPARWLLVAPTPLDERGARAARWRAGCAATAAVTDLSSATAAFILAGTQVREMLARGCRLDLHPHVFPPGTAAATVIAQVPVTLAALPHGMLLLTPSSTGQHFAEWLESAARPFGRAQTYAMDEPEMFSGETVESYL